MMKTSLIQNFKKNRARELYNIYNILQNKLRLSSADIYPILKASQELEYEASIKTDSSIWGYSISDLVLPIRTIKHIKPKGLEIRAKIDCSLKGNISKWGELDEALFECEFSVTLYGELNDKKYSICWHVDRDDGASSEEYHPLYHLHYSDGINHLGTKDENKSFDWGNAIYLDCPRIVHCPLDLILGIGFYLTNFHFKGVFDKLINEHQFSIIYKHSQDAILKPYFNNIASHWDVDSGDLRWKNSKQLCPIIID